tara:strand:- start:8 stop:169 length:162 start_codon:yes stop_codon:yes gene_type:complete
MAIKILVLLIIIILVIFYRIHLTKKENFQVKYIRDLNTKLDKIIKKKKTEEIC